MTPDQNISAELSSISTLVAGIPRNLPYKVPEGYFEALPTMILKRVSGEGFEENAAGELAELSPLLAGIPKKTPFSVPDGYFDRIPEEVNAGLSGLIQTKQVLETLPGLLESARNINPYAVPAGYFDKFPSKMLRQFQPATPVVTMRKKILGYAAAALVAGIIVIGSWLYFQRTSGGNNPATDLAFNISREINQLSDQSIIDYADSTQSVNFNNMATNEEFSGPAIHFLLEDVSDVALQEYLSEQPGKVILLNN